MVGGIYLWEVVRRKRVRRQSDALDSSDMELLKGLQVSRELPDDGVLGGLESLRGERLGPDGLDMDELRSLAPSREEDAHVPLDVDREAFRIKQQTARVYSVEPNQGPKGQELIVVMNVMAEPGQAFQGSDVRKALADVDMQHGDMQIFHHYGVGDLSSERPVFSAANMLEPGYFDPQTMDEMTTPGLCLFMRLPGPLDPRVGFELMLNTGQRLATALGGELRDETRSVLGLQTIGHLRERITEFGRKQLASAG